MRLKIRIETDEYIFEEYEEDVLATDDHPSTSMHAWLRSIVQHDTPLGSDLPLTQEESE